MSRRDRKQRKKKDRQERIRRARHDRHTTTPAGMVIVSPEAAGPRGFELVEVQSEVSIERDLRRWQEGEGFLARLVPWLSRLSPQEKKRRQAQELAYDALEEPDPKKAEALARQALALDPDCADAFHALADATKSSSERLAHLGQAVAAGERWLGEAYFREHQGEFWRALETRPYMRAREALAFELRDAGRLAEAIGHLEALLELNPNDNQGVRHPLFAWYFVADNLEGVRRLLATCAEKGDDMAVVRWSRALERFLAGGRGEAAEALAAAQEGNPYVRDYLTGKERLPAELPDYHGFGDVTEAMFCASLLGEAWGRHPQAVQWLKRQGRA
jgi:tetratricopeptide (TPR) repeat protein